MLAFVWSDSLPLYSGRGGSETYTIGQVRELQQRGIQVKIITIGLGERDGREFFPDITFESLGSADELVDSEDTLIYINYPYSIKTKRQSYVIMHIPPQRLEALPVYHKRPPDYAAILPQHKVIVNSRFLRDFWAGYAEMDLNDIHVVYPFADPAFAAVERPKASDDGITNVLFAGRLNPEKGIYTFLEALHHPVLHEGYRFTVTTAGDQTEEGEIIARLLRRHPLVKVVSARRTPEEMAELFALHQVVVMPSNHTFWHEAFGMISVEAQHAGCWVVASNDGGLPETDCGSLSLFEPGNSLSLAKTIQLVAQGGAPTPHQRKETFRHFTRRESTDSLLAVLNDTYGKQANG